MIKVVGQTGFPGGSVVNNPTANAGDTGSIPGLGRCPGGGNGTTLQYLCLENSVGSGAWWAAVYGVSQSWTRLKRLSSSSSSILIAKGYPGEEVKDPPVNAGGARDTGSIPGLGRSPRGGNGNPLQDFCLKIPCTGSWRVLVPQKVRQD